MFAAAGAVAPLDTLYAIPATNSTQTVPATSQVLLSEWRAAGRPAALVTGCPQRWQKRAWGESSAWQWGHARRARLAPHALQNLPVPGVPQAGQLVDIGEVMEGEA
jgi:hypothetical protein